MSTTATLLLVFSTASHSFNLPPGMLSAVCYVESHHDAKAYNPNDGHANSVGLCQIQLPAATFMGFTGSEVELKRPETNAYYAAKYLRHLIGRYGGDLRLAISAYNSGTVRYNYKGQIKNRKYVGKVMQAWLENR